MPLDQLTAAPVGRAAELRLIDSLLADPLSADDGLLLRGGHGVGKTTLLSKAAEQAKNRGFSVLWISGLEFEAQLPFAAVHQLLYPVRELANELPASQRSALRRLLCDSEGPLPDRMVVSTAVLSLLDLIAAERPVLLLVDNAQWIDQPSAEVLGFLAHRLVGLPIVLVAATGLCAVGHLNQVGLTEHEVSPLDPEESAKLLTSLHPELAQAARRRVLKEAAGIPLVLQELPAALSEEQRRDAEALPMVLPLSRRLEKPYAARIAALPARTRHSLLLAALDSTGDLTVLKSAAGSDWTPAALDPAERAGFLRVTESAFAFCTPLVRATVVHLSSAEDRRTAHRCLASALSRQPDRYAWHLASAVVDPDETVAVALEGAGLRAARRNAPEEAVSALMRAAEISPARADRSRRLTLAAESAWACGSPDQAYELMARAGAMWPDASRYDAAATIYFKSFRDGDLATAARLLLRALADEPDSSIQAEATLEKLLWLCQSAARPDAWAHYEAAIQRHAQYVTPTLQLYADALGDPARTAHTVRERLSRERADFNDPSTVVRLAVVAVAVDSGADYRGLLQRIVDRGADQVPLIRASAMMTLCEDKIAAGLWDDAERLAAEATEFATAVGFDLLSFSCRALHAMVLACRGEHARARELADEVVAYAAPQGMGLAISTAARARCLSGLGSGDYEDAYIQAVSITPPGTLTPYVPHALWTVFDLVEAAMRTGRTAEAEKHVKAARTAHLERVSPRLGLIVAGASALVAPDESASELFALALALPGAAGWPVERARIQLAFGEWLRRNKEIAAARSHLKPALETFERLGALPWARRARQELRATGVSAFSEIDQENLLTRLTNQERQIAQLAASGLTNKQIGAHLFLSPRTVGTHLYKLFPKLGVTSRAALRDALAAAERSS